MKVSWDDDIPNIWKVIKVMFQTTNQWDHPPSSWLKTAWLPRLHNGPGERAQSLLCLGPSLVLMGKLWDK